MRYYGVTIEIATALSIGWKSRRADWTHRDPFEEDYDFDGRLGRLELGQRYARRRLLEGASDELIKRAKRVGSGVRPSGSDSDREDERSRWRRRGNSYYLASSVLDRFDKDRNGHLDVIESAGLGIPLGRIDVDRDGELSRDELQAYMSSLQEDAGDETLGIPTWFYERDQDRDNQVTMAEYTDEWTDDRLTTFAGLDANDDGILTRAEVTRSASMMGGSFANTNAEVLPPRQTVISEITIAEDFSIADVNVQLSITHTHVDQLDGYLIGPDGTRLELFSSVGGYDDNFDNTIFDDDARTLITKARPPFEGTFLPEAIANRKPGLSQYIGQSAKGTWQLVLAGSRNDRFGMLHQWSLIMKPQDRVGIESIQAPESDLDDPQEQLGDGA